MFVEYLTKNKWGHFKNPHPELVEQAIEAVRKAHNKSYSQARKDCVVVHIEGSNPDIILGSAENGDYSCARAWIAAYRNLAARKSA